MGLYLGKYARDSLGDLTHKVAPGNRPERRHVGGFFGVTTMAASPGGSRAYLPRYRPTDENYPCNLCRAWLEGDHWFAGEYLPETHSKIAQNSNPEKATFLIENWLLVLLRWFLTSVNITRLFSFLITGYLSTSGKLLENVHFDTQARPS